MLRREYDVNMRVRLLLNISRDVASGSNMVPIAAERDVEREAQWCLSHSVHWVERQQQTYRRSVKNNMLHVPSLNCFYCVLSCSQLLSNSIEQLGKSLKDFRKRLETDHCQYLVYTWSELHLETFSTPDVCGSFLGRVTPLSPPHDAIKYDIFSSSCHAYHCSPWVWWWAVVQACQKDSLQRETAWMKVTPLHAVCHSF